MSTAFPEITAGTDGPAAVLPFDVYYDRVLGGWLGKCIGGTAGARYEGVKRWIELDGEKLMPDTIPPNDDLDLQILWLKVLEERGPAITADDLAAAWERWCWYPFCEYGIFRRNWRLGIRPPMSGRYNNQMWEHGMGCPIRSEIWGYILPGRPEEAARFAAMDASLDHGAQSAGAECMFSAMAADAFYEPSLRTLIERHKGYLPAGTPIAASVDLALEAFDAGAPLRVARERIMLRGGYPEACDAQTNVPFTVLSLLYGEGDLEATLLAGLRCGYDTDCTMATAGAFIGQILGAQRIPDDLKAAIGDELVMGIAYRRDDMTISALARDTARIGVLFAQGSSSAFADAPDVAPFPPDAVAPPTRLSVAYEGLPAVAPGASLRVRVRADGAIPDGAQAEITPPPGWSVRRLDGEAAPWAFELSAPEAPGVWPMRNIAACSLAVPGQAPAATQEFGIVGAGIWRVLGVYYDTKPQGEEIPDPVQRAWHHHFAYLHRDYIDETSVDVDAAHREFSELLGKPAVVPSYEHEIDLDRLIGLRGPYCAYLSRTILVDEAQDVHIVIGNTDPFRLYLNGALVGERDEHIWWTPQNNAYLAPLSAGPNRLLLKLIKQDSRDWRFTLGFRVPGEVRKGWSQHFQDWHVGLADQV